MLVLGTGTVGSQLLAQITAQQQKLAQEHSIAIRVVGVCDSKKVTWNSVTEPFDGSPAARKALSRRSFVLTHGAGIWSCIHPVHPVDLHISVRP